MKLHRQSSISVLRLTHSSFEFCHFLGQHFYFWRKLFLFCTFISKFWFYDDFFFLLAFKTLTICFLFFSFRMTFRTISGLAGIFWISLRTTFIAMSIGKSFFESFRTDNSLRHPALSFFRFWSFAFSHCIGEKLLFGSIEGIIFYMRVDLFGLNSLLFWGYNFYFDNCLLIANMNVSFDRISHFFIEVGDTFDWPLRLVPTWKLRWVPKSDICIFSWAMSFGIRGCVIDLFFVSSDKRWLWG